ncbi:MAG: hypothetical protein M3Q56_01405 [Bacteroidota bacterium]|nr:hypothetical protein [Bacteroidota bacterium]
MKYIVLLVFGLWFSDWVRFEDSNLGFSILLPNLPVIDSQDVETDIGNIFTKTYISTLGNGRNETVLMVNVTRYPQDFYLDRDDSISIYIMETIKESLLMNYGTLVYEEDTELNGYKTNLSLIHNADDVAIKTAMIVKGNRLYTIQSISPFEDRLKPEVEKFFNSFRLMQL